MKSRFKPIPDSPRRALAEALQGARLEEMAKLDLAAADRGYLRLAELLLTGVDSRQLPEGEKANSLFA